MLRFDIGVWRIELLWLPIAYSLDYDRYIFFPPSFFWGVRVINGHILRHYKFGYLMISEGYVEN